MARSSISKTKWAAVPSLPGQTLLCTTLHSTISILNTPALSALSTLPSPPHQLAHFPPHPASTHPHPHQHSPPHLSINWKTPAGWAQLYFVIFVGTTFCATSYRRKKYGSKLLFMWFWKVDMDENYSFWDMMEPHISSIQQYQCGSNTCNIKGDIVQNVVPALLVFYPLTHLTSLSASMNCTINSM